MSLWKINLHILRKKRKRKNAEKMVCTCADYRDEYSLCFDSEKCHDQNNPYGQGKCYRRNNRS